MNRWYGVRVPAAYESSERWFAINRVGGWWLVAAGGSLVFLGVTVGRLIHGPETEILLALAPVAVMLLAGIGALIQVSRLR